MTLPLKVDGLVVRSDRGRALLTVDAVSASPGSMIGVRGPSGAGKSTLLFALAGLLESVEGEVCWGDTALYSMSRGQRAAFRAEHMGMVFQDFLLFEELNAASNAGITAMFRKSGLRAPVRQRAEDTLHALGLDAASSRGVSSFSGGERQRIAVARALANDAAILLADEPTASLHREAADQLIDDLTRIVRNKGKTMVAVSHDPALLERMDRVVTIENGIVTEDKPMDAA